MDFKKQIKHPEWQKKRLKILERDDYTCQECGNMEKQLHVHHYIYHKNRMLWEYEDSYLITLCESCHKQWHEVHDSIKEMLCTDTVSLTQLKEIFEVLQNFTPSDKQIVKRILIELMHLN